LRLRLELLLLIDKLLLLLAPAHVLLLGLAPTPLDDLLDEKRPGQIMLR
jgi:hypothetical protein